MNDYQTQDLDVDPITGEVIDPTNADHLIDAMARLDRHIALLRVWKARFEDAIAAMAAHKDRTERVAGEKRVAKVEWPGTEFDPKMTKHLWDTYPQFRDKFLRLESVGVQRREYDKLTRTNGTEEFEMFKKALMVCERQSQRRPAIKIEA